MSTAQRLVVSFFAVLALGVVGPSAYADEHEVPDETPVEQPVAEDPTPTSEEPTSDPESQDPEVVYVDNGPSVVLLDPVQFGAIILILCVLLTLSLTDIITRIARLMR